MDRIKCEICSKFFKGLAGHLKCKHDISTDQYRLLYPGSPTLNLNFYKKIKLKNTKKCVICDSEFSPKDSRTTTCSKKCRYKKSSTVRTGYKRSDNYINVCCKNCGKEDYIKKYQDINHFCDKKCYLAFHKKEKIDIECAYSNCTNNLKIYIYQKKKYCSRACYKLDYNESRQYFNANSRYKKGYYISYRNNTKNWYDSSWELSRMKQLDLDDSVKSWSKNKIKIKYRDDDGSEHIYTPDLMIEYKSGLTVIEEIKGRILRKDVLKMESAIPFLKNLNIGYKLIQKYDIYSEDFIEPIIENYENKFGKFQRISLLYTFVKMCLDISNRSTCIRRKVGCIITPSNFTNISSIGYNGSLPGEENGCHTIDAGKCGCIHAEINALKKFKKFNKSETYVSICTLSPCLNCAKEILKYPIKKVIYLNSYRDTYGLKFLRENNIEVSKYSEIVSESNRQYHI